MAKALPELNGDACILDRVPESRCSACAAACPTGALALAEDGSLLLDPGPCTSCGGCAAACPVTAIRIPGIAPVSSARPDAAGRLRLICPDAGGEGACLHALGPEALSALWLQGLRHLIADIGDCAACPNGAPAQFPAAAGSISELLADRRLPGLRVTLGVQHSSAPLLGTDRDTDMRRRALFSVFRPSDPAPAAPALETLQRSGASGEDTRFAHVPVIDPDRCIACHACTRICPTGSLTLINADDGYAVYHCDAAACNGCGLCRGVCGEEAVSVIAMATAAEPVGLVAFRCRGCGVPGFHLANREPDEGLCPICKRSGHFRKLHMVL